MEQRTPNDIAQEIMELADQCSKLSERLNELEDLYCIWWKGFRDDFKSDKSAEKAWDLTTEGMEMRTIKMKLKVKDRKISANKTYLRVLQLEAQNQY